MKAYTTFLFFVLVQFVYVLKTMRLLWCLYYVKNAEKFIFHDSAICKSLLV